MGHGVFGILDVALPRAQRERWLDTALVLPADWPAPLHCRDHRLPNAVGLLARESIVDAPDVARARMLAGVAVDELVDHEVIAPGRIRLVAAGAWPYPLSVADLHAQMRQKHADREAYMCTSMTLAGLCTIEAYFADYGAFCFGFDPFMLPLVHAAALGARGHGVFLWDADCEEPVCMRMDLGDGIVRVTTIDPQNAHGELIPRWEDRCRAILADYEAWAS